MSIIWEIFITVYQVPPEGAVAGCMFWFCSILCHKSQPATLEDIKHNQCYACLPASLLSACRLCKVLRVQHPSISSRPFKFQQNARFSVLTDNESIFLTNNKLDIQCFNTCRLCLFYKSSPIQTAEKRTQKYKEAEGYNKGQSCEHNNLQLHCQCQCSRVM